ncbi:EamA family transporter RarD [Wenzhouxiangella limi]|uniref:EamA family transporter RarD n=1 Tax=Wenzhouxiangella limi TaxID=2707351 RepID=A0A845VGR6_9GAMM|nr:EamA family transporter RarD [Wenzhouxiangella limi]
MTPEAAQREARLGLAAGLGAFSIWGLAPIYFKLLAQVRPDEIIGHRVLWSVVFLGLVLLVRKRAGVIGHLRINGRTLLALCVTGGLIGLNWLIFVYAVNTDRVLSTSLGYFINPLMSVVLGLLVFRERLVPAQSLAILIAAAGTAYMAWQVGEVPWISLSLAATFAVYGLIRKLLDVGPMVGLFWETLIVSPLALGWLWLLADGDRLSFDPAEPVSAMLLAGTGLLTVAPLLLFAAGVRRLPLTTIGLMQYLAPSLTFILAVFVFGEPFTMDHAITFGLVWLALALFFWAGWQRSRHLRVNP